MKMIPEHAKRIKSRKEQLMNQSHGHGTPYRDAWQPRRPPAILKRDVKLPADPEKKTKAAKPHVFAEVVAPSK
jgi:hypothetical protein